MSRYATSSFVGCKLLTAPPTTKNESLRGCRTHYRPLVAIPCCEASFSMAQFHRILMESTTATTGPQRTATTPLTTAE